MAEAPLNMRLADLLMSSSPSPQQPTLTNLAMAEALRPSWETNATPLSRMGSVFGQPEARSYSPSLSERVGNSLQDLFMSGGMEPYTAGHLGRGLRDLAQISPLGVPMAVGDFQHSRQQGDMLGSVLNAAAIIPGAKLLPIKSADEIYNAIRAGLNSYETVGLRSTSLPLMPDRIRNSREWIDGKPTRNWLDGVSTTGIRSESDIERAMRAHQILTPDWSPRSPGTYHGKHVSLLGSDDARSGADLYEMLLTDPKLLGRWLKPERPF